MSGLISYEYEGYKPIAVIALGFLAGAAGFSLFWPPTKWSDVIERSRALVAKAWRPAIAFPLAAGVARGAAAFWRPFRLFFLAWYVAAVAGGALAVTSLNPGRVIGAVIPGIVLIALLIDDGHQWLFRRWGQRAARLVPILLLGAAGYVAFWNASTFNAIANNPRNVAEFADKKGQLYSYCAYMQGS